MIENFDDFLEAKYPEIRSGINESVSEALKSLVDKGIESIDAELKARNKDREILINQAEQIEKTCLEIKEDPFGLNVLKEKALADKANLERNKQ